MNNAVQAYGADLAEPLARHWEGFRFIDTIARLDAPRSQWARAAVLKQIDRIRDPEAKDMERRELSGE